MKIVEVYQSEDKVYFIDKASCENYEKCMLALKDIVNTFIGTECPYGNTNYKKHELASLWDLSWKLYDFLLGECPELSDDLYFKRSKYYLDNNELQFGINIISKFLSRLTEKYHNNCINVDYKFYFEKLSHRLRDKIDFEEGIEYGTMALNKMYSGHFQDYLKWREEEIEANKEGYTTLR